MGMAADADAMGRCVRVSVEHVDHGAAVGARVAELAERSSVKVSVDPTTSMWIALVEDETMPLAIACAFHWGLADVEGVAIELFDPTTSTWTSVADALEWKSRSLEHTLVAPRALSQADVVKAFLDDDMIQVIDARPLDDFLGMGTTNTEYCGHLDNSISIPFASVMDEATANKSVAFLPQDALVTLLEAEQVDFMRNAVVIGSSVAQAATVATALALAGHAVVAFSLVPLDAALISSIPSAYTKSIFPTSELFFQGESGTFDLSPEMSHEATEADRDERIELEKEYKAYVKKPDHDESSKSDTNAMDEVVWVNDSGHRYFDMPHAIDKSLFLATSRDIYRVVSFVLAPLGFPTALQERFSVSEVKTRCSALFQDVIEVCSDLVYQQRELSEGAMAMSVHKWVEQQRDGECMDQVRAINDLLDTLYAPPVFIEVPDVDEARVLELADKLHKRLLIVIQKRAPWALEGSDEEEVKVVEEKATLSNSSAWGQCMYTGVVYALGFLPDLKSAATKKKQRLSTLQIKSFIHAVAETSWGVIKDFSASQIEFQALCDTMSEERRMALASIKPVAERTLYVVKHSLARSLERDEELVEHVAAVREATESGDRAYRSGRHEVALAFYSKALDRLPMHHPEIAPLLVGRAKCFVQLGFLERAQLESKVLLTIDPFNVGAYSCLGEIDEKAGSHESAMQHFVTAFILDGSRSPEHAGAIDRVARLVGRSEAKDIFSAMVLQHELPTQWLVASYFDSFEHDIDNATRVPFDVEKTTDVAASDLTTEQIVFRAVHYKRTRNYTASRADVFSALARDDLAEDTSLHLVILNLHASFLYVAGDVHAALDVINDALAIDPSSVNSLIKKGGFLSEVGEMDEATECFNKAAEVDTNEADVYLHMGQKELLDGSYYQAVQCLRRAISRSEVLPVTHVSYGMALYKSGSTFQAIDVFEEAARMFPESPEVHLFYGEVLADQGDYAGAMRHFLKAFELSPLCPLPFLNAGRVYVSTNDPLRAIAHFQQALAIDPRCSSAHLDIAQVLFAQGRPAEAFEHFDLAAHSCRFLPEVEEVCAAKAMAKMQERVTDILGVDLRHIMRSK